FPNPHVPERRFRYQLPHDALAELQKSLDAGEQDRFYFPQRRPDDGGTTSVDAASPSSKRPGPRQK
ncbi:MAG: hypothetical protein WA683_24060, partial [Pseudolabrys sp.]